MCRLWKCLLAWILCTLLETNVSYANPHVLWSTYLGGKGPDEAIAVAVDPSLSCYVTGITTSDGFPNPKVSTSPLQGHLAGGQDAFVAIYNPVGQLIHFTYFGGSGGYGDRGEAIAVDEAKGLVYLAGGMNSVPPSAGHQFAGHFHVSGDNMDGFVAILSIDCAHLKGFRFVGGNRNDEIFGLAVSRKGIYVCGYTSSKTLNLGGAIGATACSYCATHPAEPDYGDAFVARLGPDLGVLGWRYIGRSNGWTFAKGITIDDFTGDVCVTGVTKANGLQTMGPSGPSGDNDAFVARFSSDLKTVKFVTYVGGHGQENDDHLHYKPFGIVVDRARSICIPGETTAGDFPTKNPLAGTAVPGAFVTTLDPTGAPLRNSSGLMHIDANRAGRGRGIATGPGKNLWIAGMANRPKLVEFNTIPGTSAFPGGKDFFVTRLAPHGWGYNLVYSTYLGGRGEDEAAAIAVDRFGSAYVVGKTHSTDFFPLVHPDQPSSGGDDDGFVVRISRGDRYWQLGPGPHP
jgi:hypothetical protein